MDIITTTSEVEYACRKLSTSRYITIDTEFLRERTFWSKLCLIQVAMEDYAILIDPLASDIDLSSFYSLLRDQNVLKVMHGCRQDIEIFHHMANIIPTPLLDTQVMAMICGFGDSVSYESLVQQILNIQIDKASRFTNWDTRPLSQKQFSYALADVTHLRGVFETLETTINKKKRQEWIVDEMEVLLNPQTYEQTPEDSWKRLRFFHHKPHIFSAAIKLAHWREIQAQTLNIPRGHVIKDETIREIALQFPKTIDALQKLRGVPKGLSNSKHAKTIISILEEAQNTSAGSLPDSVPHKTNKTKNTPIIELLKVLLKHSSKAHDVASKIIANTNDLELIASLNFSKVKAMKGWRKKIFGEDALNLVSGKLALSYNNNQIILTNILPNKTNDE